MWKCTGSESNHFAARLISINDFQEYKQIKSGKKILTILIIVYTLQTNGIVCNTLIYINLVDRRLLTRLKN